MNYPDPELDLRRPSRPSDWSGGSQSRQARRRFIGVAVAVLGILLFSGMLWQVYRLGKMTGSEEAAPLIQADRTPTKIRPEQPGGIEIPHQDRLIFDRANGGKPATVDNLLDLPEEPLDRPSAPPAETASADPENKPSLPASSPEEPESLFSTVDEGESTQTQTLDTVQSTPSAEQAQPESEEPLASKPNDSKVAQASSDTSPTSPAPVEPKKLEPVPTEKVNVIANNTVPGQSSGAPQKAAEKPPASKPPVAEKKPKKEEPKTASSKTSSSEAGAADGHIQIAAVRSEADARAAVARLQKQFPDDLGPLRFRINKVVIDGKGIFYRIQAGPVTAEEAKPLCDKLKAKSLGCMLVK